MVKTKYLSFTLLLLTFSSPNVKAQDQETEASGTITRGDDSGFVSVAMQDGQWKIYEEYIDWNKNDSIVAIANLTNAQDETGWNYLEIQTRESSPDQLQAQAAGLAEGYLTRTAIIENYKEFFGNDICASDPDACEWIKEAFRLNTMSVEGMISQKSQTDPYWHMVNLMYLQMNGVRQGYQMKALVHPRDGNFHFKVSYL